MVEGIQQGNLPHFTTVKYVTKDGENCTATKQNGVVTVVGDKNGVRQMPLDDFMADLVQNLPKVNLENSPKQDTVSFSGKEHTEPEEGKSSKVALGVLAALGTAVIGAGVYLLTKGKAKKISPIVDDLTKKADDVLNTAKKTAQETVDKAKETIKPTIEKVDTKVNETIDKAKEKIQPAVGKAKETIKPAVENVETKVTETAAQVQEKVKPVIEKTQEKAGELKDRANSFAEIMSEIFSGNKNAVQTGGKTSQAASKTKSSPKAKPSAVKADTNAKTQPQVVAPKSEAKPVQPKTKAVENEVKVEPKKPEAVKPQETKKDTIQEMLDDIDKQQKEAQKLAEQQQKEQQIIDDNNMLAAALLLDGTMSKGAGKVADDVAKMAEKSAEEAVSSVSKTGAEILDDVLGHKPAAVLADDAGKAVKDELHIADDLLADAHIDAPKSNSWDEPVDFMTGNGAKAADDAEVLSTSSYFDELDESVDLFPKSSSYDEIDDMFKPSQIDDFSSDLGSSFDDFNHGMDDFGSGFDDFGGDMF